MSLPQKMSLTDQVTNNRVQEAQTYSVQTHIHAFMHTAHGYTQAHTAQHYVCVVVFLCGGGVQPLQSLGVLGFAGFNGWKAFAPCCRCLPLAPLPPLLLHWFLCCRWPSSGGKILCSCHYLYTDTTGSPVCCFLMTKFLSFTRNTRNNVSVTRGVGVFSTSRMSFPMLPLSWILCMASFTWE